MFSPELIIFDCDGVLIDSEGIATQVLVDTLAEYGIRLTFEEAIKRYTGFGEAAEKADIKSRYQMDMPAEYFEKKHLRRVRFFEEKLQAMPGVMQAIDAVPFRKCIASGSSPERLRHSLGLVGFWDRFAPHIFSATQVKNGKPAPDLFLFAAEQMDVAPSACLVIEDSIAGVQAAKAAGMRVFGFAGGAHCGAGHGDVLSREGAEAVFTRMDHVAEALRQFPSAKGGVACEP